MRKTFALQVSDKNLIGLKHYGYDCHVPEQILISSYLVFGHGGPYIINAQYFKDTFEYNGENAEIELVNLLDFGAAKDERTLRPFVPRNPDIQYWDAFVIQLFYDKKHDFSGSFEAGISVAIPT